MSSNDPLAQAGPAGAQLVLQAVYLKDCSFESPLGPRAQTEWNPQISLDLNTSVEPLTGEMREVILTVTVSAKQGDRTMFLVEVKQAGAFVMQNLAPEEYKRAAGIVCPGILFPYARAVISHMVSQGGFPQLLLPPVNFEALFNSAAAAPPASTTTN